MTALTPIAEGADFHYAPHGEEMDWQHRGACREVGTDAFFPPSKGNATQVREAKKICNGPAGGSPCPVLAQCRDWALLKGEKFGVWGGLSERDRRAILKRLGR